MPYKSSDQCDIAFLLYHCVLFSVFWKRLLEYISPPSVCQRVLIGFISFHIKLKMLFSAQKNNFS